MKEIYLSKVRKIENNFWKERVGSGGQGGRGNKKAGGTEQGAGTERTHRA